MKRTVKQWLGWGIGIVILGWIATLLLPKPLPVETARAGRGPMRVTVDEEGETRARDRYTVAAPIAGRLLRIALREGDPVKEGDLVARVDPRPLDPRERAEAEARVEAAEATRRAAEEAVGRARAEAEQARREARRLEKLLAENLVSSESVEQARTAAIAAERALDEAVSRARAATADRDAARAVLIASGGAGGGLVEIRSPVAGQVLRVLEESERVVLAGTPLLVLGDPAALEIVVDVLSTDAVKIAPGAPVFLEGWGGGHPIRAKVRRIEPAGFTKVSALGIEEQRVNVRADFVDPPGPLGDGYRVEARIVIWEGDGVLKVPASTLFRRSAEWAVFVADGGRARARTVQVGHRNPLEAEILGGIPDGAEVVLHPANELSDGARIGAR